jgi:SAM-dependent methyltransferase
MRGTLLRSWDPQTQQTTGPEVDLDYYPSVFNVQTIPDAKRIILTPDNNGDPEQRWQHETPATLKHFDKLQINSGYPVLDYGCGIGRLSKLLIDHDADAFVVGVDISRNMRALAGTYVNSDRFAAMPARMLRQLNIRCCAAVCVYTLQHCEKPVDDIELIQRQLLEGGRLLVINEVSRYVPATTGSKFEWLNDGQDVWAELASRFRLISEEQSEFGHGRVALYENLPP